MRIGIVTQPLMRNYGGILQNYALQQVLERLGHTPITIDFIVKFSRLHYALSIVKAVFLYFFSINRHSFKFSYIYRNADIETFIANHINVTHRVNQYSPDLIEKYNLNAVITGSDQVWRPLYNRYIESMYLSFVNRDIRKIAYAVSFGVKEWEYSSRLAKKCSKLAQNIDAISVREHSGVFLCEKYLHVHAISVLDPTLLLDKEDYMKLCSTIPLSNSSYIAAYILDMTIEKKNYIDKIASHKKLPIKYFSADYDMSLSIEEWLAMFRDTDFVVTDSFHGTIFSILFNKPFCTISNDSRGRERFVSLLNIFGLDGRLLNIANNEIDKLSLIEPNWENVNQLLTIEREKSIAFLINSLIK